VPGDPGFLQQWAFGNTGQLVNATSGTPGADMNLKAAWNHITDCSSVVVAVIDGGINYNHQDMAANMWDGGATYPLHGYNFTNELAANDPMDRTGHGTHVAGIIGAVGNNSPSPLGTAGVCWKANIMAVRALDSTGAGTTARISQGINFAVSQGAKVINMSLGGVGTADPAMSAAIDAALAADVVVVVAAGNSGLNHSVSGNADYPCDFTQANVICVAALDQNYNLASFSDWGVASVDVGAPGTNILSSVAGTSATFTASLNPASWTFATTTAGGFASGTVVPNAAPPSVAPTTVGGVIYNSLNDPGAWGSSFKYTPNTDDRMWSSFDFSPYAAVKVNLFYAAHVTQDGYYAVAYSTTGGDPFAALPAPGASTVPNTSPYLIGPYQTDGATPSVTPAFYSRNPVSLTNCLTATCSVGFRLKTGALQSMGLSLVEFTYTTLTLSSTTYSYKNGTSMATPAVTGVAAMLRAYNPQYTYADVVSSIKNAGRTVTALVGKTTTGRAVDAMKSLSYINPPTGLSATVQ
jgi:subtilisin family serine protease